ncbi:MAG: restriction endonuclease subunit S [Fastidiosipilaceae bacterium]|jgi:type I restriction enzyme S subunit
MSEKLNLPAIRFRGFVDDWEQRELGKIGNTFTGLSGKTKEDFGHGDAKFITYMNVFSNPISDFYGTEQVEIDDKQNQVKFGDVFFTTSSETPDEVGMSSVWLDNTENIYLNSFCFGYRPTEKMDPYYLAFMLRSPAIRKEFTFLAQGISRYNISKTKVMEMKIPIPELAEQVVVGEFFKELDQLITLHQRKLEKLQNVKKAMLGKMFPKNGCSVPEIRFEGFTDDWEQRKIGNEVNFFSGLTYSPDNVVENEGTFVLRSSNVKNGEIVNADDVYVQPDVVNSDNVQLGDIIVVVRNGSRDLIGKHAQIKQKMNDTVIGAFMTGIRSETPNFTNAMLDTQQFNMEINKNLGATINQITTGSFKNMKFIVPTSKEEKEKVGDFFNQLDNLITLHQRKHEKLKNIKKSMLDKMFV